MNNYIMGILFVVMGIIVLFGVSPAITELANAQRNADSLNCNGYAHATDPALSYNASRESNVFGCTVTNLALPLLILGVIIAGIMTIMYGQRQEQPSYPSAYGGY